jgi:hypothetical protein
VLPGKALRSELATDEFWIGVMVSLDATLVVVTPLEAQPLRMSDNAPTTAMETPVRLELIIGPAPPDG